VKQKLKWLREDAKRELKWLWEDFKESWPAMLAVLVFMFASIFVSLAVLCLF
jgi:hypothetical protein